MYTLSMLKREQRLTRKKDFEILFKEGRFVGGEYVSVKVWEVRPEKYPKRNYTTVALQIGFVVGLKVSKSAVKRNRIKRQMREVVRLLLLDNKIKQGFMIVIMAKPNAVGVLYADLEKDIVAVLKRSRVFV